MTKEIEGDTGGDLKKIYLALLTNERKEKVGSAEEVAAAVDELYKAGEGKVGTNEGAWIKMLTESGRGFMEQVYWAYAKKHGKALDQVIKSEFSGNVMKCLVVLITPLDVWFCGQLTAAMAGAGTNDKDLLRLIVTQKERWLIPAAKKFLEQHKKILDKAVKSETSGDYQRALVATCTVWAAVA